MLERMNSISHSENKTQYYYWTNKKNERLLIIKMMPVEGKPFELKIEKKKIFLKGEFEKKVETQNKYGSSVSIERMSLNQEFPVPSDCDFEKAKITQKEGEIIVHFPKKKK